MKGCGGWRVHSHWNEVEGHWAELGHLSGRWNDLGVAAGTRRVGLKRIEVDPGKWSTPGREAEHGAALPLGRGGDLRRPRRLGDGPARGRGARGAARARGLAAAGHPSRTRLRGGGSGLTLLTYGTREPNDTAYYPRSGIVAIRGLGLLGRLEPVDGDETR